VRGTFPDKNARFLGVVGTRKATESGKELARHFGVEIARSGCVVVSGMALGIDAAAHAGCLDAHGATIAVLGNGLDRLYPRTNEKLGQNILVNGGALISEYPPGAPPLPSHFLERNRIVSGLSRAVVIIEAPARSGALATARYAALQGREVFVVPGPARHPHFTGSHMLLRNGARLVTNATDILEDLAYEEPTAVQSIAAESESGIEHAILEVLRTSQRPVPLDALVEATHFLAPEVIRTLSFLTLSNRIEERRGGFVVKAR
ncbi:MAG: DNA-processing protein DprA, partial [Patescibacteria group bacterium]